MTTRRPNDAVAPADVREKSANSWLTAADTGVLGLRFAEKIANLREFVPISEGQSVEFAGFGEKNLNECLANFADFRGAARMMETNDRI